jgi:hypothetical protein
MFAKLITVRLAPSATGCTGPPGDDATSNGPDQSVPTTLRVKPIVIGLHSDPGLE